MPTAESIFPVTGPAIVVRSRTVAVVAHPDHCTLCEACLDACSRGALTLRETAQVDAALCTGCGACESACPNGVFELTEV
jgi:ferredoxin